VTESNLEEGRALARYHMKRKEQEIADRDTLVDVLKRGKYAIIAMCRQGEPYIVTLNHGYDEKRNALYFHCALEGLKIDFIRDNPEVCATVIEDRGYRMGECEQAYRSVVLWGKMYVVDDLQEKKHGIDVLLKHLEDEPDQVRERSLKSDEAYQKVGILRLDVTEMSGKQGE
jgi:nitroimidazol reductase NimA-like FMN-containing flavoprotein (pyridoxamine 5'-phosphate oxidase superfamily)